MEDIPDLTPNATEQKRQRKLLRSSIYNDIIKTDNLVALSLVFTYIYIFSEPKIVKLMRDPSSKANLPVHISSDATAHADE